MKTVGLITEYNPFHNGHLYHIEKTKEVTKADYIVVIMSGDFVQRGVPAMMNKYVRTEMALRCGADLVLELPVCYATGSAEYFASGAIAALDHLNVIDELCFGSECGNIDLLTSIAQVLVREPEDFKHFLKEQLQWGLSFPSARSKALLDYFSLHDFGYEKQELEKVLHHPNNILGIEYIKALLKRDSTIKPVTINRTISGYHETSLKDSISSATAIRQHLMEFNQVSSLEAQIPRKVLPILLREYGKSFPIWEDDISSILNYKLLLEQEHGYSDFLDVSTALHHRIMNHLYDFTTYSDFVKRMSSKQFTTTRIQRSLLHILLDIKHKDMEEAIKNDYILYHRVLGFRKNSTELLSHIKKNSDLPLVTKVASSKNLLNPYAHSMLEKDLKASHIYHTMVTRKYNAPPYNEYRQSMIMI